MDTFEWISDSRPTGDQPQAIEATESLFSYNEAAQKSYHLAPFVCKIDL